MKLSTNGLNFIKSWEGLRLKAYYCANNKLTIGYGHTGSDVKPGMIITEQKAEELLRKDLTRFEAAVSKNVTVPLSQNQYDALVSFAFNVGIGNFTGSTLLKELNKKNYEAVPAQLRRWVYGDNQKLIQGLVNRRNAEIKVWDNTVPEPATPSKPPATKVSLNARIKEQTAIIAEATAKIASAQAEINRLLG